MIDIITACVAEQSFIYYFFFCKVCGLDFVGLVAASTAETNVLMGQVCADKLGNIVLNGNDSTRPSSNGIVDAQLVSVSFLPFITYIYTSATVHMVTLDYSSAKVDAQMSSLLSFPLYYYSSVLAFSFFCFFLFKC